MSEKYNWKEQLHQHHFDDHQRKDKWLKRYIKFIDQCISKHRRHVMHSGLTHTHHIVPRGWGGPDISANKVVLTIKEHIIAHHLLARTHDPLMAYAFHMLISMNKDQFQYNVSCNLAADALICKKLSQILPSNSRPVVNLNTGEVYRCLNEAERTCGDSQHVGSLSPAIKKGIRCRGYFWEYVDVLPDLSEQTIQRVLQQKIEAFDERQRRMREKNDSSRPVINLGTKQVFKSAVEASKSVCLNNLAISNAIRNDFKAGGYWWDYVDRLQDLSDDNIANRIQQLEQLTKDNQRFYKPRAVIDLTTGEIYPTLTAAAKAIGVTPSRITIVIQKDQVTKGHKFAFVDQQTTK